MQLVNEFGRCLCTWWRFLDFRKRRPRPARNKARLELCALETRDVPAPLGVLVPAYFTPRSGGYFWDQLVAEAGRVPIMAIMNPEDGPGMTADPDYVEAVNRFRAAGGQVIGYVKTRYTARPLDVVKAEIDAYQNWYNIDGVFVDQMTEDAQAAHLAYYQAIYDYVHGLNPQYTVVGNPGTNTVEAYVTVADVLVLFENGTGYDTYTPPAWQASYPAERFAHLVYNVPSPDTMRTYVGLAVSRNTGWVYITDDGSPEEDPPNPWDTLPTYWTEFVQAVAGGGGGGSGGQGSASPPADLGGKPWAVAAAREGPFDRGDKISGPWSTWVTGAATADSSGTLSHLISVRRGLDNRQLWNSLTWLV
jgi:hypothetical protein